MKSSGGAIGIFPLYCILSLAIGLMNHVLVIPPLLTEAERDAWITILGIIVPYLIWVTGIYYIMKKTRQQPLIPWLSQHYGNTLGWAVRIFFIAYLFLICAMTVRETAVWTHVSYLPRTPEFVLALTLVLFCYFAVQFGMRSIAITSGILLPLVVIFGDFVLTANLPKKDYTLLFPMLENGIGPVLKGGIYLGGGLVELVTILLLQHHLKTRMRLWSLWLLAVFLVLLVLGPATAAIAEFGPFEAAKLRYPAYEQWRLVRIGKYINHVDFLSIHQWLSGATMRISISLYIVIDLLNSGPKKFRTAWLISLCILLVLVVGLPVSDMQYLFFLKHYYFPVTLSAVVLLSLGLLLLATFAKNKGEAE